MIYHQAPIAPIILPLHGHKAFMLRLDLIGDHAQGNKYFKLYYNLKRARDMGKNTLLSFGGAFSNHIHALASMAKAQGFKSIGIIRMPGWQTLESPTLDFAEQEGMQLIYVTPDTYRMKEKAPEVIDLLHQNPNIYTLPEGGSNLYAVQGSSEILNASTQAFELILCSVGTGSTLAGLAEGAPIHQKILGVPVVKDLNIAKNMALWTNKPYELYWNQDLPRYGTVTSQSTAYADAFYKQNGFWLDPIYTLALAQSTEKLFNERYPHRTPPATLLIHTGGLQGWGKKRPSLYN